MLLKRNDHTAGKVAWGEPRNPYHFAVPYKSKSQPAIAICHADVSEPTKAFSIVGSTLTDQFVNSLAWDSNQKYNMGLLATGSDQGIVTLWDPEVICSSSGSMSHQGLIAKDQAFENEPITSLQFNSLKNNLIAVGSSEVLIVDIKRGGLDIFSAGQNNPHEGYFVTTVAWNKKIEKILASAGQNGQVVFWDVLANKYIFQLEGEETDHKNISLAWNPFIPTQIAVASDDDMKKELMIWDLRNSRGPILRIDKGYTKGITSLDWSSLDHNLLLASSKDSKIICWDLGSDCQIVTDCSTHDIIQDIRWNRKIPSVFLASSQSSTQVYCLSQKELHSHAPQWYKPAVSLAVSYNNTRFSYTTNKHTLQSDELSTRTPCLAEGIEQLENVMQENERQPRQDFYTAVKLAKEGRQQIFQFLKFDRSKIIKEVEDYTGKKHSSEVVASQFTGFSTLSDMEADSFFDSLGKTHEVKVESTGMIENEKIQTIRINKNWNVGKERIIKQNLLVGNFEGAVDAAMKSGRMAEGLVIAYSQSQSLFQSTLKTFFTQTTQPFITDILKNLVENNFQNLIEKYDLTCWRECLAIIIGKVHKSRRQWVTILAQRLLKDGLQDQALVCLALVQNYPVIVEVLWKSVQSLEGSYQHQFMLKAAAMVLFCQKNGTQKIQTTAALEKLLLSIGLLLLDEGRPELALSMLRVPIFKSSKVNNFIKRLAGSMGESVKQQKIIPLNSMKKQTKQAINKPKQETKLRPTFAPGQSKPSAPPSQEIKKNPPPPPKTKMPGPPPPSLRREQAQPKQIQSKKDMLPPPPPTKQMVEEKKMLKVDLPVVDNQQTYPTQTNQKKRIVPPPPVRQVSMPERTPPPPIRQNSFQPPPLQVPDQPQPQPPKEQKEQRISRSQPQPPPRTRVPPPPPPPRR